MTAAVIELFPTGDPTRPPVKRWTLRYASDLALEQHWQGMRKESHSVGRCDDFVQHYPRGTTLDAVTTESLAGYLRDLRAAGLGDEACKARMCAIGVVYQVARRNGYDGPAPIVPHVRVTKKLKWWLNPEREAEVLDWLVRRPNFLLRDFVEWTAETGLRIEETLACRREHFGNLDSPGAIPELFVPGTKTDASQATLALSRKATRIARRRLHGGEGVLFDVPYLVLWAGWDEVREAFGWKGIRTATLKSLRRSFTRRMMVKRNAPLPVAQRLLRQASASTTMEYMRLTGGDLSLQEMAQWLDVHDDHGKEENPQ